MRKELIDAIKNSKCTDRVLVWSACRKTDDVIEDFRKNGIEICGYIDSRADEIKTFNGLKVYNKDIIKKDKYFVYIGIERFFPDIIEFMHECRYKEFENYWYPCHLFKIDSSKDYNDIYGNVYQLEETAYNFKLEIGGGSKCVIGKGNKIDDTVHIKLNANSVLEIGDNNVFSNNCILTATRLNSNMKIGSKCFFMDGNIIFDNVQIDDYITAAICNRIGSSMYNKVILGRDCMLANSIYIRAGSNHNLYNLETNENITINSNKDVILHEHVWVGEHAYIYNGADIGSGSVVGANTFVNKKFPNNVAIAGNPARIVKNRIAWRRDVWELYDSYEDFKEFDFTEHED